MSDEKAKIFAKLHWEDAAAEDYADPKKAFTVYVAEPPDDWKEGMKHEIAPLDAEDFFESEVIFETETEVP